jgi:acyl carrier protein
MNTTRERYERIVRDALHAHGALAATDRLEPQDDLYACGLTSLASARVMLALEGALSIEFPERMLGRGLFTSVERLTDACAELVQTSEGSEAMK